jgi:hypothetical protein
VEKGKKYFLNFQEKFQGKLFGEKYIGREKTMCKINYVFRGKKFSISFPETQFFCVRLAGRQVLRLLRRVQAVLQPRQAARHPGAYPTKSYKNWFTNITNYKYL